jgi:hypothetical protein
VTRQEAYPAGTDRTLLRENQPVGFLLEANVLDNPFNVQVYHRPEGKPLYACLGEWSLLIPENIVTGRGVCLPNSPDDRLGAMGILPEGSRLIWQPVPGLTNAIYHEYHQEPPLTVTDIGATPEEMVDRRAHLHYRAQVTVSENVLDVELAITNLSDEPTSFFSHLCSRFMGRGYVWGWQQRTYVQIAGEWVTPSISRSGKWFVEQNLPSRRIMEYFREGSAENQKARVTSPVICMQSENGQYAAVCGSPQGSMVFINAGNLCLHSDPNTPCVEPETTATQKWSMRVYELPYREAIARFESEVTGGG